MPPELPAWTLLVGTGAIRHQHSKPGIAAEHMQAACFLARLGMTLRWNAYAFSRWPQLGDMEPAELRVCVGALLAAFGGGLSAAELRRRLRACPELLMLSPEEIAAVEACLVSLGLADVEMAAVLAAEPKILTASAEETRDIVSELRSHYQLSPAQLRAAIIEMPRLLSPAFMAAGFSAKVMKQVEDVIAKQHQQSS